MSEKGLATLGSLLFSAQLPKATAIVLIPFSVLAPKWRCLLPQAVGRWVLAVTAHPKIRLGFMTGEILDLT
jgi:hypothetical protein